MGQISVKGTVFAVALAAALFPQVALANSGDVASASESGANTAQVAVVEKGTSASQLETTAATAGAGVSAKAPALSSQADTAGKGDATVTDAGSSTGAAAAAGTAGTTGSASSADAGSAASGSTANSDDAQGSAESNSASGTGDTSSADASKGATDSSTSVSVGNVVSDTTKTDATATDAKDATAGEGTADKAATDGAGAADNGKATDAKDSGAAAGDKTDGATTDAKTDDKASDDKADAKTDEKASKKKYETPVKDGVYEIYLGTEKKNPVEVADGSRKKGANVQLGEWDNEFFQKWSVVADEIGYYTFTNVKSGLRLAVKGGKAKSGATVVQAKASKSKAQKWIVIEKDGGFNIVSALSSKLALNVKGSKAVAGKDVRVTKSGSKAQKFNFKKRTLLPVGTYVFQTKKSSKLALATPTPKRKQNIQMRLKTYNRTAKLGKFYVRNEGKGLFSIQSVRSGLYLAQRDGKVVQRKDATSEAQRWKVVFDGGIVFQNAKTGKVISIAGDTAKKNAKIKVVSEVTSNAQRWYPVEANLIETGVYAFQNRLGKYLTVKGGSFKKNANVNQSSRKSNGSQTFQVDVNGKYYRFMNMRSYRAVAVKGSSKASGANVVQRNANINSSGQLWKVSLDRDGYLVFKNKKSGKVLAVKGNSKKSGANVVQATSNGKSGQEWRMVKVKRYSFTGDTYLDQALSTLVGNHPSLPSLFSYLMSWPYREGQRYYSNPHFLSDKVTASLAADMWRHGSGNCYRYACLFSWGARALGYRTNVVSGWVPSVSGGQAPHGWVEVYQGGHTYICDPDLAHDYGGWGFYMTTYYSAPTSYGSW